MAQTPSGLAEATVITERRSGGCRRDYVCLKGRALPSEDPDERPPVRVEQRTQRAAARTGHRARCITATCAAHRSAIMYVPDLPKHTRSGAAVSSTLTEQ